jgi:hypothetical protein
MFSRNRRLVVLVILAGPLLSLGMILLTYFGDAAWHLNALFLPACVMAIVICLVVSKEPTRLTPTEAVRRASGHSPRAEGRFGFPCAGQDDDVADEDSMLGRWSGIARIWPASNVGGPSTIPVEVFLTREATRAQLISSGIRADGNRVVGVEVVEYDAETGNLDLGVTVASYGMARPQQHIAQLVRQRGCLISEDLYDRFTLELRQIAT